MIVANATVSDYMTLDSLVVQSTLSSIALDDTRVSSAEMSSSSLSGREHVTLAEVEVERRSFQKRKRQRVSHGVC